LTQILTYSGLPAKCFNAVHAELQQIFDGRVEYLFRTSLPLGRADIDIFGGSMEFSLGTRGVPKFSRRDGARYVCTG
jgi:hypothetical protein